MARIKLNGKVKASSILETVISMVVIVTVFTIALMIFGNVQRLSLSAKKVKVDGILNEALLTAEKAPSITKQSFTVDNFRIEEEISAYNNTTNLYLISLVAYDPNQEKIAQLKEVVSHDQ